jgi:hypothetical protein
MSLPEYRGLAIMIVAPQSSGQLALPGKSSCKREAQA